MAYQRPSSSAYLNVSRSDDDEFWVYSKPKTWNRDLTSYLPEFTQNQNLFKFTQNSGRNPQFTAGRILCIRDSLFEIIFAFLVELVEII